MSYTITTIEQHKKALQRNQEVEQSRFERQVDVGDSAASSWASGTSSTFHQFAIQLLENGIEHLGEEKPCQQFSILVDSNDNTVSEYTFIDSFGNLQWELTDEQKEEFGRYAIPYNSNNRSRVHKELGFRQIKVWRETKTHVQSHCACAGAAVSFHAIPA